MNLLIAGVACAKNGGHSGNSVILFTIVYCLFTIVSWNVLALYCRQTTAGEIRTRDLSGHTLAR